jgi:hypothetical protein
MNDFINVPPISQQLAAHHYKTLSYTHTERGAGGLQLLLST